MGRALVGLANALQSADWILPAYITLGVLDRMAAAIRAAPVAEKHKVLERELPLIYDGDYLAVMLLERYSKVVYVADFAVEISEAIEASQLGLHHAAVATLIPVFEGVVRKIADARGQPVGSGTRGLVRELDALIEQERTSSYSFDERVVMLECFRDFVKGRLLVSTADYGGVGSFNRHGILHGVFSGYGHGFNFCRIVSFIDMLCFVLIIRGSGMSALAPDFTPEARKLARYYLFLQCMAPIARLAGARR